MALSTLTKRAPKVASAPAVTATRPSVLTATKAAPRAAAPLPVTPKAATAPTALPPALTPAQIEAKRQAAAAAASKAASDAAKLHQIPGGRGYASNAGHPITGDPAYTPPPPTAPNPQLPPRQTTAQTPGMTAGVPQTQFEGLDMTQYGPLEDLWRDQGAKFFDPTNSQAWWNMVAPGLTGPGQGQTWVDQNAGFYGTPGYGEGVNQEVSDSLQGPSTTQGYWDENGQFVQTPGMGEGFAGETLDKYASGTPDVTNRADEAYKDFLGERPDILSDAGLEGYYDFAKKRGGESLNRELAARGVYGSGRGLDKLGDMYGGLEAELANRKADYYLRSLAEQRGWAGLGLQGASSADMSSLRQSQNELGWMQGLGGLAFQGQDAAMNRWMAGLTGSQAADASGLARAGMRAGTATNAQNLGMDRMNQGGDFAFRAGDEGLRRAAAGADIASTADMQELSSLNSGFNAAGATQNAERTRGQDYFNNTFATGNAMAGMFGDAYGDVLGNDQASFDAWAQSLLGYSTENLNRDDKRKAEQAAKDAADQAALRAGIWGAGAMAAPYTYGASLALPVGYEIYKGFGG